MKAKSYPGDADRASEIIAIVTVVTGTRLPRRIREPEAFTARLRKSGESTR